MDIRYVSSELLEKFNWSDIVGKGGTIGKEWVIGEVGGTIGEVKVEGVELRILTAEGSTVADISYIQRKWPEVFEISEKLTTGRKLDKLDKLWVKELAEVTGWSPDDIIDELKNLTLNPSERAERYHQLHEKYLKEAIEYKEKNNTSQAGEKIWGAVTALIKLYAATKGIPIIQWSISKLYRFVDTNVKKEHRKLFRDLLDKTHILHEHFYEKHLSPEGFEERWKEVLELLKKAKKIVSL